MEEIDPPNDISITQIDTGDGDGAGIVLDYNGLQVSVSIFSPPSTQQNKQPEISTDILESRIIRLLEQANSAEEIDDDYENILDEVLGVILTAWKHGSNTPTPLPTDTAGSADLSLHSLLFPPTLSLQLSQDPGGAAVLTTIEPHKAYSPLAADEQGSGPAIDDIETVDSLPRYTPKAVSIQETFVQGGSHIVSRVQIDNHEEWLCKACAGAHKFLDSNFERELEMSHDIRKACLSSQDALARVPQLRGYIEGPNTGFVIGFLRQWIPGKRLSDVDVLGTGLDKRKKWMRQIRETLARLHEIDVIWGDGKASNIIIDDNDDAWLIDFGGGFTDGWVSQELAGTIEGDKQAETKLEIFLGLSVEES
ncbi:hypothetical protein FDECE_14269 [Fusarium decemcellulare]|nr:hypothetical protein FDECE_14269 [Fusarium decemcellulare]